MSLIIDIADAVAAELNAAPPGTFAQAFTAARQYRPQFDLAELKTLRVSVVPKAQAIMSLGRTLNQHDLAVDVAVQKKLDDPTPETEAAEMDGLMLLAEQIADFFRLRRLTAQPGAVWVKTEHSPIYAMEHLEQKRVFTGVLTFTFRVMR